MCVVMVRDVVVTMSGACGDNDGVSEGNQLTGLH